MIIDPCRCAMNDISSSIECEQLMDPGRTFWNFLERLVVGRRIWIFSFIPKKKRENCATDWYTSRRSGIWWPRLVYFHERNQPNNRVRAPIFRSIISGCILCRLVRKWLETLRRIALQTTWPKAGRFPLRLGHGNTSQQPNYNSKNT